MKPEKHPFEVLIDTPIVNDIRKFKRLETEQL